MSNGNKTYACFFFCNNSEPQKIVFEWINKFKVGGFCQNKICEFIYNQP